MGKAYTLGNQMSLPQTYIRRCPFSILVNSFVSEEDPQTYITVQTSNETRNHKTTVSRGYSVQTVASIN